MGIQIPLKFYDKYYGIIYENQKFRFYKVSNFIVKIICDEKEYSIKINFEQLEYILRLATTKEKLINEIKKKVEKKSENLSKLVFNFSRNPVFLREKISVIDENTNYFEKMEKLLHFQVKNQNFTIQLLYFFYNFKFYKDASDLHFDNSK